MQFPIPGNDDAIRAIKLFAGRVADAHPRGRAVWDSARRDREAESEKKRGSDAEHRGARARPRGAPRTVAVARAEGRRARTSSAAAVRGGAEVAEAVAADEPTAD